MGQMVDRIHCALKSDEMDLIVQTYHAWRGTIETPFKNVPGFCHARGLGEIRESNYILTPGRYVPLGVSGRQDEVPPAERFAGLAKQLEMQFKESNRLEQRIRVHLEQAGHGI
jgi:type I restriction enzyme M protein